MSKKYSLLFFGMKGGVGVITKKYRNLRSFYRREKNGITIKKYIRNVRRFAVFAEGNELSKTPTVEYKTALTEKLNPSSMNKGYRSACGYSGTPRCGGNTDLYHGKRQCTPTAAGKNGACDIRLISVFSGILHIFY